VSHRKRRNRARRLLPTSALLALLASLSCQTGGPARSAGASGPAAANPFAEPSPLPFQAPPFDRIRTADFQPAIEEGTRLQLAEVRAVADDPAPASFENTIVALERSGQMLTRVMRVFLNLTQADTSPELQKIQATVAPLLAAHQDAIYLDPKLHARVERLYERRDALGLDPESRYLVERYRKDFVRAGAALDDRGKAALREMNQEESKLTAEYSEKLLADTNARAVVVDAAAELDGLPSAEVAAAAEAASEAGKNGKWLLTLQATTQQPPMASLSDRALRRRVLEASESRCGGGGPNDTTAIVARLAQLRQQRANLLGFATYADYALDDQMARTAANARKLLSEVVGPATARARAEAARLQQMIDAEKGGFPLGPADWTFYSGKVFAADYAVEPAQVGPYLELDRVLNDGVFYAANRMYGITLKERRDLPVYQKDVRVWEVFDADGKSLALFYGDFFLRPSKAGGAWCDSFVQQNRLLGTRPVVVNVTNFTRPAAGRPALLTFDDVTTLFHEFGHALHAIFADVVYPTLADTPNDFGEFPSQFNEHWAFEPSVLARYARHFKTGAPMPLDVAQRIIHAQTFNQGFATTEYAASALLDLDWHSLPAGSPLQRVDAFEAEALRRDRVDLPEVPPRYRTAYFSHIWDSGYAAGYYAYLWSDMLDEDSYQWFAQNGGMTRENGSRFRNMILSRGGSEDVSAMYRAFRGRDPAVEPLLEERGLSSGTPAAPPK
jgi:peptidyl-dipeptidase Dcp